MSQYPPSMSRALISNLVREFLQHLQLTYLLISHDLSVVSHVSCIAVTYPGQIVEFARRDELFSLPMHPYT